MEKLTEEQIASRMEAHNEWSETGESIQRTFQFDDFLGAMRFVNRVAELAERDQHHPDVLIRYNKVTLTLSTHDAGGLTSKDFALATEIDDLIAPAAS